MNLNAYRTKVVLRDRLAEIRLSPTEARIVDVLTRLHEGYGVQVAKELSGDSELATVYVLLERMERKGVLTSRVEEARTPRGRRVIRRLYRLSPTSIVSTGGNANEASIQTQQSNPRGRSRVGGASA